MLVVGPRAGGRPLVGELALLLLRLEEGSHPGPLGGGSVHLSLRELVDPFRLSLHGAYIGGGRGVKDDDLGSLALVGDQAGQP